jgi:hypothetical protein
MYPLDRVTMLVIDRPNLTPESLSMSHSDWMLAKSVVLFPDGCARESSDHPRAGVTVSCKWQGHFVVAHGHEEKWVLSTSDVFVIDMGYFGPEWSGCSVKFCRGDNSVANNNSFT